MNVSLALEIDDTLYWKQRSVSVGSYTIFFVNGVFEGISDHNLDWWTADNQEASPVVCARIAEGGVVTIEPPFKMQYITDRLTR